MKKTRSKTEAEGNPLLRRAAAPKMSKREMDTLKAAGRIRQRHSAEFTVRREIQGIWDYALVSKHPNSTKAGNLGETLEKTRNSYVKRAIEGAIGLLGGAKKA